MMPKHTAVVLKEMCKRVGANYDDICFKEPEWFRQNEWMLAEQDDFKAWLVSYLMKNSEARKEMTNIRGRSKKLIEKAALWFVFSYGWRLKE